jgi:predicted RNA polymerase sigma factor
MMSVVAFRRHMAAIISSSTYGKCHWSGASTTPSSEMNWPTTIFRMAVSSSPELCQEALRLGRMLAELAPDEPEAHGLVALMEIQASRARARVGPDGEPVLLLDQNRGRWDQLLIRRGFAALLRARQLRRPPGPYVLQAAIAACHAQALRGYHRLPAVRGDLLARLGRLDEAREEFLRAAELAGNAREQAALRKRAAQLRTRTSRAC